MMNPWKIIDKNVRRLNKLFQDFFKPKRLALGRFILDRNNSEAIFSCKKIIEENSIKSIVFMRYDGKLGDMIVNSFIFREIKRAYPHIKIGMVVRSGPKELLKDNPYIDKFYNYENKVGKIIRLASEIKKDGYDLLIDFNEVLRVRPMFFIKKCGIKINIGIKKDGWNMFQCSFSHPKNKESHIQDTYIVLLDLLGVEVKDRSYDLYIDENAQNKVEKYIESELDSQEYIVFNPYAASKHRSFNFETIKKMLKILLKYTNYEVVLIGTSDRVEEINKVIKEVTYELIKELNKNSIVDDAETQNLDGARIIGARAHIGSLSLIETMSLIKGAKLVVTPDTSIVHMASAFQVPQIAFYRKDKEGENNTNEWGPNSSKAQVIYSENATGIADKSDINSFDMSEFEKCVKKCR